MLDEQNKAEIGQLKLCLPDRENKTDIGQPSDTKLCLPEWQRKQDRRRTPERHEAMLA